MHRNPVSKYEEGVPPPTQAPQRGEMLPLLLPAVVPEQATLGSAGVDKQAGPDLRALPLQLKPKKCALLQGQADSSSSQAKVAQAGEGCQRAPPDRDLPLRVIQVGQRAVKSCHGLFRVHSHVPNNTERTWSIAPDGNTAAFFFLPSPQISHSEETATEVIHMLSTRHCVATSCM